MILTLALLIILIQTPVWFLLIFAPESKPTQQITGNYAVFVVIGIVYIFFAVAIVAYALSLNSSVSSALASVPNTTGVTTIDPEALKPLVEALKLSANVQPTLIGALLGTAVLDLAGGLIAFREMRTLGTPRGTRSILLVVMYLLGPVGMLIFGAWHYLSKSRVAA